MPSAACLRVFRLFAALTARRAMTGLFVAVAMLAGWLSASAQTVMPAPANWVQAGPATPPPARRQSAMAYDAATGTVILFGGYGTSSVFADTWIWNGATWTQLNPATSPPARYGEMMAYDAATRTVILFGGYSSTAYLNDTWSWNGTTRTWTQIFPASAPTARVSGNMAYDTATGTLVLFSGVGSLGYLGDTWVWNGTTWTQKTPASSPSAREFASMSDDPATGNLMLFGGYSTGYVGDTWLWNGSTWTSQSPATSPSGRFGAIMAYDTAANAPILFGGYTSGGLVADTWVWNGTNWAQQSPAASPGARDFASMAYDAATSSLVLLGGYDNTSSLGDTWTYGLPQTSIGTVAVGAGSSLTVTFRVTGAGTLGTPVVLTQGALSLDFTLGTGSTCTGAVTAGNTCTINVQFTPLYPGQRMGAVEVVDASGHVLATTLISGTGTGPLGTLSPGTISTVAGNGTNGYVAAQDGGLATSAELNNPSGVAVDGAGNLYIADNQNNRIRKVTAAAGIISTIAGDGTSCSTAACGDGGQASSAQLAGPKNVALDGGGNLYIVDGGDHRIRKLAATGIITTVAGTGAVCYSPSASCGDGGAATSAQLSVVMGLVVSASGDLYISDYNQAATRIRKVTASTGVIATVAGDGSNGYGGDGGPAMSAPLNQSDGVAFDLTGNLYIAETGANRVRKVAASTGIISTVAGNGSACPSMTATCGDGGAGTSAQLFNPEAVSVDGAGNVYIADAGDQRIRKVSAGTGIITTIAGNGTYCSSPTAACGDGGPATGGQTDYPTALTLDSAGDLYIVDQLDNRIRKVTVKSGINFPTATAAGTADTTDGTRTLTLNNIGNLPLTIASMQNSTGSYVLANPMTGGCSTAVPVPAGGSCLLGEQFTPVAGSTGVVGGSLAIMDNNLNATSAVQFVPLSGTTAAGAVNVIVTGSSVAAGSGSAVINVTTGYSGTASDTGAVVVKVNGSATGVSTPTCTYKGGHSNCNYTYTGTALATPGTYPIAVSVAADSNYSAGSGSDTLTVTGSLQKSLLKPIAAPVTISKIRQQ